jgi:hypothetical protein
VLPLADQVFGVDLELIQLKLNFGLMEKLDYMIDFVGHVIKMEAIGQ